MTMRYEASPAATVPVAVIPPDSTDTGLWDEEFPAEGRHALTIGDPWASAYAAVGTLAELGELAGRITAAVRAAGAPVPAAVTGGVIPVALLTRVLGWETAILDRGEAPRLAWLLTQARDGREILSCGACGEPIVADGAGGFIDFTGRTCEDPCEECPACECGEEHPHAPAAD